jgi:hypothetical protein
MTMTKLDAEHILSITALTGNPAIVAGAPQGTRGVLGVTGGTFKGPRLRGEIVAPSGDWFTARSSGTLKIDARLLLVADDGGNILLTYSGVAVPKEGGMQIRVAPLFEAPDGPHSWLNDLQAVGFGEPFDGGVRYDIYALG